MAAWPLVVTRPAPSAGAPSAPPWPVDPALAIGSPWLRGGGQLIGVDEDSAAMAKQNEQSRLSVEGLRRWPEGS